MKILQIINSLATGGAEKLILETVPLYNKKGVKTDVLVFTANDEPFLEKLQKLNCCQIFILGNQSSYNPLNFLKLMPFLKRYDIIHVHLFPALYWVAFAKIISFSKIKLVFTEHSTSNRRMNNVFFKHVDNFVYSKFNIIVTISREVDFAIKKCINIKHNKFQYINNGVDISTINNSEPTIKSEITNIINENRKIIIQVSSFQYPKDHKTLIRTLKYLDDDIILVLVGEGIEMENMKNYAKKNQVNSRVFFLGIRMDVSQLLKTADIVVLSSHHEGMSLSSIEGLASGKPFIASNVPGLTEVVEGAGLLFEDNNDFDLANHIKKLLADEHYYKQIATQCQERAKAYDIEIMIEKHIELYKSLVNA
ncbi:glycosyltransferase [Flavobacterium sp.]|uniref:glycosyltransferase n=1 Tax=Flavobacterium sp. TaxID=239 RepID=UPI003F69C2C6